MAIPFTPQQEEVIRHKNGNLLVSAAAGSGKTAVLVERIIHMMMDPLDPVPFDRILVLTFTNAAAAQMKEKIEKRVLELLAAEENKEYLEGQYHQIPLSHIQTNHAYALSLVRDYITRLEGIDPGYRIADETEIRLLRVDVLNEVLEDYYSRALEEESETGSSFMAFVQNFGGAKQDTQLTELVLDIYEFMMSDPDPMKWLHRSVEAFSGKEGANGPWENVVDLLPLNALEGGLLSLQNCLGIYQTVVGETEDTKTIEGLQKYIHEFETALFTAESLESVREKVDFLANFRWTNQKYKLVGETYAKALKNHVEHMKSSFKTAKTLTEELSDSRTVEEEKAMVYPSLRGLEALLTSFHEAYTKAKKEKNLLEFSDFEHGALKILEDPSVCEAEREKYRYIFIDEYQDCNRMQEEIIRRIARYDIRGQAINVFMVGDVKQSIYRFRQADPSMFIEKYDTYGTIPGTRRLLLNKNFRSGRGVIDAVNFVFESLMQREVGGIGYSDNEKLYQGNVDRPAFSAQLTVLENDDNSTDKLVKEAEIVTKEILDLVEEGYHYRDIVILLRSAKTVGREYMEALLRKGIPAYASTNDSFYDTREVRTVLNLLRVIDNPHQDIPLLGVLYSPIVGLSDDDLSRVRIALRDADFFDALQVFAAEEEEDEAHRKVRAFLTKLSVWRKEARLYEIHDFIWMLLTSTGYLAYVKAMPSGDARKANLELLLQKSIDFEKGSYSGVYAFLRYIEQMDRDRTTEDEAKLFSENQDIVRIMTIHQSKGLEYKVVILPGLGRKFNQKDLGKSILMHDEFGLGVDVVLPKRNRKYPSYSKKVLREVIRRELVAEEMRLLYVAMTRACERLLMIGSRGLRKDPPSRTQEKPENYKLQAAEVLNATSFLDWIEPIVMNKASSPIDYSIVTSEEGESLSEYQTPYEPQSLVTEETLPKEEETAILSQLKWAYDGLWKQHVPQVVSVSQLKHSSYDPTKEEEITPVPSATFVDLSDEQEPSEESPKEAPSRKEKQNIGARRGTAFHAILSHGDLARLREDPAAETKRLVDEGILSFEDISLVPKSWIRNALSTPVMKEVVALEKEGRRIFKEESFILRIPYEMAAPFLNEKTVKEIQPEEAGKPSSETLLVQGIIDLFFVRGGRFVLVDFKTDWELDENRIREYTVQLDLYQRALEAATGRKVASRLLIDVRRGKEIEC